MLIDAGALFEDGSVIQAGVSTTVLASQNVIDFGVARNLGVGKDIYVVATLVAPMVGASSTLTVKLQTSPDNATWTDEQTLGTFPALAAVGGASSTLRAKLQPDLINARYGRLTYTVNAATLTSAQLKAALTESIDDSTSYPNNSQITG